MSKLHTPEELISMGWEACRRSIYAVCEDVQEKAIPGDIKPRNETEAAHERGYYSGQAQAAKSIARGFGSMEALNDDSVQKVIAALPQSSPSDAFAAWLNEGPKLALAAGCYVGIKVTGLKE